MQKNDPLYFFIQRLRDEAHRFAIKKSNRSKRKKNLSKSLLDQIEGVGKRRKRKLLNHYIGQQEQWSQQVLKTSKNVEGIEDSIAKKIYDYFHE